MPGNSYHGEEISQGNNQINSLDASLQSPEFIIPSASPLRDMPVWGDMGQNRSDEDMGGDDHFDSVDDSVDSPGTLAHPSPITEELEFEDPIGGGSSSIGEPINNGGQESSHVPLPAYWIRTGNSFMLIGESREECEMIMGARGVGCRFLQYSGR